MNIILGDIIDSLNISIINIQKYNLNKSEDLEFELKGRNSRINNIPNFFKLPHHLLIKYIFIIYKYSCIFIIF